MPDDRKPDAVLFLTGWVPDTPEAKVVSRGTAQLNYCRAVLGATPWQRDVGANRWLVSPVDLGDTEFYPDDHALAKQPRFEWVDQPNGCKFGYLKEKS